MACAHTPLPPGATDLESRVVQRATITIPGSRSSAAANGPSRTATCGSARWAGVVRGTSIIDQDVLLNQVRVTGASTRSTSPGGWSRETRWIRRCFTPAIPMKASAKPRALLHRFELRRDFSRPCAVEACGLCSTTLGRRPNSGQRARPGAPGREGREHGRRAFCGRRWLVWRTQYDHAGLGDWVVDPEKFPNGLKPLIDKVHGLGMSFGLWVEPEMVNPDSDLYRAASGLGASISTDASAAWRAISWC